MGTIRSPGSSPSGASLFLILLRSGTIVQEQNCTKWYLVLVPLSTRVLCTLGTPHLLVYVHPSLCITTTVRFQVFGVACVTILATVFPLKKFQNRAKPSCLFSDCHFSRILMQRHMLMVTYDGTIPGVFSWAFHMIHELHSYLVALCITTRDQYDIWFDPIPILPSLTTLSLRETISKRVLPLIGPLAQQLQVQKHEQMGHSACSLQPWNTFIQKYAPVQ